MAKKQVFQYPSPIVQEAISRMLTKLQNSLETAESELHQAKIAFDSYSEIENELRREGFSFPPLPENRRPFERSGYWSGPRRFDSGQIQSACDKVKEMREVISKTSVINSIHPMQKHAEPEPEPPARRDVRDEVLHEIMSPDCWVCGCLIVGPWDPESTEPPHHEDCSVSDELVAVWTNNKTHRLKGIDAAMGGDHWRNK